MFINLKKVWKENRYTLSTDEFVEKVKANPIYEALNIQKIKDDNSHLSNSRIAKNLGKSRVRITQMLNLLKLAPDIQEQVLKAEKPYTERQLRPLTQIILHDEQRECFRKMS